MRQGAAIAAWALLLGAGACSEGEPGPTPEPEVSAVPSASATATPSVSADAVAPAPPAPPSLDDMPDTWDDTVRWKGTLEEQNALMLDQIAHVHGLDDTQRKALETLFAESERIGQGNPKAAKHAASPAECRARLQKEEVAYDDVSHAAICGKRFMAPLYDPATQKPEDATSCIDKFEFPNIPCVYPVTWARANEAVAACKAVGKRICDAHEWEGGCFGALTSVEESYNFGLIEKMKLEDAIKAMRTQQNIKNHDDRRWAYGDKYSSRKGLCATASGKSKDCGVGWNKCGSNTFPAGMFPQCVSPLGVYDQHGNAAEHMNLPLRRDQLASSPDPRYGRTEMKGSWFVFDRVKAHEDHCRWRAPYWHGTRVMNVKSHRNYHLGFRCCADTGPR
jgi:formylglycine-generating enzyme required for sulfatase activity